MKTGNLNGVDLTSSGAGTNYLADDGTYKAVSGGSQDLQSVTDVGSETNNTIRSTGAEIIVSGSGSKRFRVSSDDDDAYQTFSNEGQQIWSQGADRSKSSDFVLIDGDGLATGVEKIRVGTNKTTLSNNQLELNLTSSSSNVENVIWDAGDWFNIYKNSYEQALGGGIRLELNRDITLGPNTYPVGLHFYEVSSGTGYPTSVGWVMGQYLSTSRAIQTYYDRYTGEMYQRYTIASNTWSTTTAGGWQQIATLESDGSLDLSGVLNLASTTNVSPSDGDIWRDSSDGKLKGREGSVTSNLIGGGGGVTPGSWTNASLATNVGVRSGMRPLRYRSDGIDGVQIEGSCKYNTGFSLFAGFTVVLFTLPVGSRPNNDINIAVQVGYNGSTQQIEAWAALDSSNGQVTLKNADAVAITELYDITINTRFSLT